MRFLALFGNLFIYSSMKNEWKGLFYIRLSQVEILITSIVRSMSFVHVQWRKKRYFHQTRDFSLSRSCFDHLPKRPRRRNRRCKWWDAQFTPQCSLVLLELCFRIPILDCSLHRQKSRSIRLISSRIDDSSVDLNQTTRLDKREKKRREITDECYSDVSKQDTHGQWFKREYFHSYC